MFHPFMFHLSRSLIVHSPLISFQFLILYCGGILFFSSNGYTQEKQSATLVEMTTPRLMGMGHAGRGTAQSNHALISNPAGLSNGSFYSIETAYFRSGGDVNTLSLNVVDSQSRYQKDRFALGLAYNHVLQGSDLIAYEGRLGFALPLLMKQSFTLLTGGAAHYRSNEILKQSGFDLDWGLLLTLEGIQIGAVGQNLLDEEGSRRFGGGIGIAQRIFTLGIDWMYNPQSEDQTVYAGLELLLGNQWIIRGGYERTLSTPTQQWACGGLGLNGLGEASAEGALSSLQLAYRRNLETGEYIFGVNWGLLLRI